MKKKQFSKRQFSRIIFSGFLIFICFQTQKGIGQQAIFNGYQHDDLNGNHFKINTIGRIENANHSGFINDDIKSIQVKPGYKATIYDHYDGKGVSHEVVGKASHTYWLVTKKENGRDNFHWKDAVSSVKVEKLPLDYREKQIEAGFYYIFNPNLMGYLRGGNNSEQLTLFNNNWQWHKNRKPENDRNISKYEFGFIIVPIGINTYNIVNAATNQLLVYDNSRDNRDDGPKIVLKDFDPNNIEEENAKFTIQHLGANRFTIAPKRAGNKLLTADFDPGRGGGSPTKLENNTSNFSQQFEFISWGTLFPDIDISRISEDQEPDVSTYKYGKSPYFDEKTIKVPFYLVKDARYHYDIVRQMEESPYYTITTKKFLVNREDQSNGSLTNITGVPQERWFAKSTVKTEGSSFSVNHNYSLTIGNEWDVGAIFAKSKFKIEFTASVGFTHSKSSSTSIGETTTFKESIAPCTEGFMKGSGQEVTIKRKNGEVVNAFTKIDSEIRGFSSIPLHPDGCTLSESQYKDALFAYNKYNEKNSESSNSGSNGNDDNNSSSNNDSNDTPPANSTEFGSTWELFQGHKAVDIASNSSGDLFVAGTARNDPGGYDVLHWKNGAFERIPGQVRALDIGDNRVLWAVNEGGGVFKTSDFNNWTAIGNHVNAQDIGVGPNGEVWVVGKENLNGGWRIFKLNGSTFEEVGGLATRISVDTNGNPWVVNENGAVFRRENNEWIHIPGVSAKDIGAGIGAIWVTDKEDGIYKWIPSTNGWKQIDGLAQHITAGKNGLPLVVNTTNEIYKRK